MQRKFETAAGVALCRKVTTLLPITSCQQMVLETSFCPKGAVGNVARTLLHNSWCGFKPQNNRGVTNHPCDEAAQIKALFDRLAWSTN